MIKFRFDNHLKEDAYNTFLLFLQTWLSSFCRGKYEISLVKCHVTFSSKVYIKFEEKEDEMIAVLKDLPEDLKKYVFVMEN